MWVVRKYLSATEGAPPRTRVNPDTGEVETTPDDGVTWVPDPRSDPRQNPAYMRPPPDVPDVRCAAAAGMVENVRKVVAAGLAFGTVGGLATALLPLLLIPGIGWMYLAIILFASVLLIALGGGLYAAMTEEVYDQLLCIFYANIDADGKVSWAQLEAIHDQVGSEIGNPLITDFIGGLFQYQREVGVTNAGVAYADPDADCGECACSVVVFYPWANIYSSTNGYNDCAINPPNCVWRGAYIGYVVPIGYTTEWDIVIDLGSERTVTHVEFAGASTGVANVFAIMSDDGTEALAAVNPPAGYETGADVVLPEPHTTQYLWLRGQGTSESASEVHVWLLQATIYVEC